MDRIDEAVHRLTEGSDPPPARRFTLFFRHEPEADVDKLKDRLMKKLGVKDVDYDPEHYAGVLYLQNLRTKEEIRDLGRKLGGSMPGLRKGQTYVESWNPATKEFHLVGDLKDFRGYYPVL